MKDFISKLTPLRALVIGLCLAVVYYFTMYDSGANQVSAINAAQTQAQTLTKQNKELQIKLDRAAAFQKTAAELGATINKLLATIPEHFTISELMKIASNEAKVAGSSLVSITPTIAPPTSVLKEFEELGVTIDMNGSFLQHMVFLSNLTKINQILIVRRFELTINGNGDLRPDESPSVHMVADLVAYRYKGTADAATKPPEAK